MQGSTLYGNFFLKASERGKLVVPFTGDVKEQYRQARNLRFQLYKFRRKERENPESLVAAFANEISLSIERTADSVVLVARNTNDEPEYKATLAEILGEKDGD